MLYFKLNKLQMPNPVSDFYISSIHIDQGQTLKRNRARSRGQPKRMIKHCSHIRIKVTSDNFTFT